ncbi:DUF1823 family protein, partial [Synechococcus sp. UW140]
MKDELLWQILDGGLEDHLVCELIWERLGYLQAADLVWQAGPAT